MSSRSAERAAEGADVRTRLQTYYEHYYRGSLGIPGWRDLVAVRLDDAAYERQRLARLESVLGRSLAGARLLNVGCGTGGFNVVARGAGADAWGVDASREAVAIAALRAPGRIVVGAAEALPWPAASFDVVYCYSTLEHVADARRAVRELVRVVRPDGALYLHTPNALACYEGHYKLFWLPLMPRRAARWYLRLRGRPTGFLDTLKPLRSSRLLRLFTEAGITPVEVPAAAAPPRESGSPLWPLVRVYYRLAGVSPSIEIVARK